MLLLLFSLLGFASSTISDCGLGKSIFTIQEQSFSPSPPIAGQEYSYWFTYSVPDSIVIDSGTSDYSVTLNSIPIPSTQEALCTQTFCPKTSGIYNESSKDIWPDGISGKVVMKLSWYDDKKNLLLCSQVTERI